MIFLATILLITPGLIALLASGDYTIQSRQEILMLAARYILFEFLSFMIAYGVITLLKGAVTISFSGISRGEKYTIFQSNTVFLVSLLFLIVAVGLGIGEKRFGAKMRKYLSVLRDEKPAE